MTDNPQRAETNACKKANQFLALATHPALIPGAQGGVRDDTGRATREAQIGLSYALLDLADALRNRGVSTEPRPGEPDPYADQGPVHVREKDFDSAAAALRGTQVVWDRRQVTEGWVAPTRDESRRIMAAVVGHGWRPRPVVPIRRLAECIEAAHQLGEATGNRMLSNLMRECEIEMLAE
jgi:hypothetical protein